ARGLLIAAVLVSLVVPAIGLLRGQDPRDMVLTALTLAFATIPQELPLLVIAVLSLGSLRLVKQGAIVRHLSATETLGATTLVCTDKPGRLTERGISGTAAGPAAGGVEAGRGGDQELARLGQLARLASEPPAGGDARLADPIDAAVWRATQPAW